MLDYEEKMERRELPDAVAGAERLARGLYQLLESMAQADQPDSLDIEGILTLMSISERCVERIETPRAFWRRRTRFFTPRNRQHQTPRKPRNAARAETTL